MRLRQCAQSSANSRSGGSRPKAMATFGSRSYQCTCPANYMATAHFVYAAPRPSNYHKRKLESVVARHDSRQNIIPVSPPALTQLPKRSGTLFC